MLVLSEGQELYVTPGGYRGSDWDVLKKLNALNLNGGLVHKQYYENFLFILIVICHIPDTSSK